MHKCGLSTSLSLIAQHSSDVSVIKTDPIFSQKNATEQLLVNLIFHRIHLSMDKKGKPFDALSLFVGCVLGNLHNSVTGSGILKHKEEGFCIS